MFTASNTLPTQTELTVKKPKIACTTIPQTLLGASTKQISRQRGGRHSAAQLQRLNLRPVP
jgi:hypothetical protein